MYFRDYKKDIEVLNIFLYFILKDIDVWNISTRIVSLYPSTL
jgi:hypothetical protein